MNKNIFKILYYENKKNKKEVANRQINYNQKLL